MRVLTGINTTGTLHLGNYCGAIRPCVQASKRDDVESFFFMADLHALIKCHDPDRIEKSRMQIAASWLACGLDPERVTFYRQSDIPEIPLLNWMLNCVCSKGLMNRAHAYKAFLEANQDAGEDPDAGVSMGLFCYPVLMAADILMFNADRVPVGRDQIQHLEMARDMATRFNNMYGRGKEFFVLPFEQIDENVEILPGLDGRKMSKSYNNVIPLFDGGEKALREAIGRIVTDSKLPGEPKDPQSTSLTRIYEAFATREEYDAFCQELLDGLGWGEAKKKLIDKISNYIAVIIRNIVCMQNPQCIILRGSLFTEMPSLYEMVLDKYKFFAYYPLKKFNNFRPGKLGKEAASFGAAIMAMEEYSRDHSLFC